MVQDILMRNGDFPADFILDDITTFKVIVRSAVPHRISVSGDVSGDVSGSVSGDTNDVNKRRNKMMEILKKNKTCSVAMLANMLGVSSRTISRDINRLKAEGKLKRVGNENTGYWEVL